MGRWGSSLFLHPHTRTKQQAISGKREAQGGQTAMDYLLSLITLLRYERSKCELASRDLIDERELSSHGGGPLSQHLIRLQRDGTRPGISHSGVEGEDHPLHRAVTRLRLVGLG